MVNTQSSRSHPNRVLHSPLLKSIESQVVLKLSHVKEVIWEGVNIRQKMCMSGSVKMPRCKGCTNDHSSKTIMKDEPITTCLPAIK